MNISTHVLDTALGKPAAGMALALERQEAGDWSELTRTATNADGRVPRLLADGDLRAGTYRLTFATGAYQKGFFPEVTIVFVVDDATQHYHVPLLFSPYGYSTYRGS